MSKRKPNRGQSGNERGQGASLGELLDSQVAEKLRSLKKETEKELVRKREEEKAQREFERKQKEKNKTFEELLNESDLDWKSFD